MIQTAKIRELDADEVETVSGGMNCIPAGMCEAPWPMPSFNPYFWMVIHMW